MGATSVSELDGANLSAAAGESGLWFSQYSYAQPDVLILKHITTSCS